MGIQSNIWKLKAERFLGDFWIFAPILVPFFKAHNLTASEIFTIEAAYNVVMAFSEIPTGYFADVMGRKVAMALGAVLRPLAILVYLCSDSFWGFVLAECCMGFSACMRSGADSSMLYDTLLELKREKEHKRFEGTAHFFTNIGTSVAGILGSLLAVISMKLPFIGTMCISLIHLPLIFSLQEPKRIMVKPKRLRDHYIEILRAIRFTMRHKSVLYASLYMMLVVNVNAVGVWAYYMYYGDLGIGLAYYGLLAALFWFFSGMGSRLCHEINKRWGEQRALLLPLLVAPSLILMGQYKSVWILPLIAFNAFLWGMSTPLLRDVIHRNTRSSRRATVLSVANMARRFGYLFFAFAVGYITDITNIQNGLTALGLLMIVTAVIPVWKLIAAERA